MWLIRDLKTTRTTISPKADDKRFRRCAFVRLKADHDTYNRFVSHLNVITSAVSLGHDESLIVFLGENDERQYLYPEEFHNGFFRFSVGIEDAEDIIADLEQAFKKENLL